MYRSLLSCSTALLLSATFAFAQSPATHTQRPRVQAVARTVPIKLDGDLDESVWSSAPAAANFYQQDPHEGQPASQKTEVRFLYDDDALYIGARMYDDKGRAGVHTRLSRRDVIEAGDYLQFVFDTYHDHTGRTIFVTNPSGVKQDAGQASPNADPSWDPVWEVASKIDDNGWTTEMRIPWAQLRFPKDSVQTWGVQIWRYTERLNETDMWSFWGKKEIGGPINFGHIADLHPAQKRGGMELLPYVVGKAAYQQSPDPGSPFYNKDDYGWRAGGDVKALLTSTLTLDATINPDFGQVEVDPAVVNLSAYETFYEEKRPFFVSGNGVFGFGGFNCFYCSNVSSMSLFYSRRIGRAPQGFVSQDAVHTQMPDNTTILGAAKITGRTHSGLQIGVLDAVTASEKATALSPAGDVFKEEVEPATNYLVARAKKNYHNGDYTFGAIGTSVARKFDSPALQAFLPGNAQAAGVDWSMGWKKRMYTFIGNFAVSDVNGDTLAMQRLQLSSARYFQRPDRALASNGLFTNGYDGSLTGLRGYGGYARIAKDAGSWLGEAQVNYRSPGFEVNDMAFLQRADYFWMNGNVDHSWTKPTKLYRHLDLTLGGQQQYNYDGDLTSRQLHAWLGGQSSFYWTFSASGQYRPGTYDDRLTRGGAVVRTPTSRNIFFNIGSDSRKAVWFDFMPGRTTDDEGGYSNDLMGDIYWKPATNLSLTFTPSYSHSLTTAQFVHKFDDASASNFYGQRIVFSDLEQKSVEFDTRISATFTSTLTLDVVLQPFIATGDYGNFKEFSAPRSLAKRSFDASELTVARDANGAETGYTLDPDHNPATANFTWSNPDFNFRSLLGNAVLRWEYRPGSTLFLVWQQQRAGSAAYGDFRASRDADALFNQHADNVFLMKVSYWLPK